MNISDYLTHIDNKDDKPYLKIPLFNVNIRLLNSNKSYRDIVNKCCEHIKFCALTKMDGYKLPHGMSGANVGIPFNIIGIVNNRGQENPYCDIMINPKIIEVAGGLKIVESNCGSIRLDKPIRIKRFGNVMVEWDDLDGGLHKEWFSKEDGGFTIQHEIDHNLGILITDRQ